MNKKVEEARTILQQIGMPKGQLSDLCCYVLLSMANIAQDTDWQDADSNWIRIHDMIAFFEKNYGITYAENSRETVRKKAIHHFRNAALIEDDSGKATNSPNYHYRITHETLALLRSFGTPQWDDNIRQFSQKHPQLIEIYASKKRVSKMPVRINGTDYAFSPGKHNQLQKAIIEEFAPRFAENSECLYVGDTTKKDLVKLVDKLSELGFSITLHDKMPDVVLYRQDKHWLYFIEAVTSVGPMSPKRLLELKEMSRNVTAGIIYVTAFPDLKTYKKFSDVLAWETEIWIAEIPDHMIHMNGDKFIGPRE